MPARKTSRTVPDGERCESRGAAPCGAPRFDVAVIGGGASGLAAAISAARSGARTCVIERDVEPGLGLLATGNGRCNISNAKLSPLRFNHSDAVRDVLGTQPERDVTVFFESLGLMLVEEDEGRLYPVTRRAESVRDVLRAACTRLGIDVICCAEPVRSVQQGGTHRLVLSVPAAPLSYKRGRDAKAEVRNARKALAAAARTEQTIAVSTIVLACGGSSAALCELFDLPHLEEDPVLCPIGCELACTRETISAREAALQNLDGLRVEGMLTLVRDGAAVAFEEGEVLFRPYGISGIAAFNLSRRILAGDIIELDLFPAMNEATLHRVLLQRAKAIGPFDGSAAWFDGLLARPLCALASCLLRGVEDPYARTATLLHHLPLRVLGKAEVAQAHVRRGGIPLDAMNLGSFAVTVTERSADDAGAALFACGEALDVDADCGGFNLAWAWLSGLQAGTSAAAWALGAR